MTFAKFQENRLGIDGEIVENNAILVNLTASIVALVATNDLPWIFTPGMLYRYAYIPCLGIPGNIYWCGLFQSSHSQKV